MRRLNKRPKPNVLILNEVAWTAAYVAAVGTPAVSRNEKWRHKEIKSALSEETEQKCAYCESFMADITYPHVEHIVPKAVRADLAHNWHNLTWACPICNGNKGDYYDEVHGIVNPYADDIESHLTFWPDFVDWPLGDVRGEITVRRLDLNRIDLVDARLRRIFGLRELLERWQVASGPLRSVLETAIRIDAREGEFTASVDAYLRRVGFPVDECADQGAAP